MNTTAKKVLVTAIVTGWLLYQLVTYVQGVERKACALDKAQQDNTVLATNVTTQAEHRTAEDQRADKRGKASDDNVEKLNRLEADLRAAGAELVRLRHAAQTAAARAASAAPQGQAPEQGSQAAGALADVFKQCAGRLVEVAAAADRAIAAGQLCEAEHAADVELTSPISEEKQP